MSASMLKVLIFVCVAAIWLGCANCAVAQDPELLHCPPCIIGPIDPGPAPQMSGLPSSRGGGSNTSGGGGPGSPGEPGVEPTVGGSIPMHPPPGATLPGGGGNGVKHSPPPPVNQHYELRLVFGGYPPDIPEPRSEPKSSVTGLDEALKFAEKWVEKAERNAMNVWAAAQPGATNDSRPERVGGRSDTNSSNPKTGTAGKSDVPAHIDKDRMADTIDKLAPKDYEKYEHKCAKNCRIALEAAGIDTTGHPIDAKDYGPFLEDHGFEKVALDNTYTQQKGDVAVFAGNAAHESGHMEISDGKDWVSDAKQKNFSPYRSNAPSVQIYRFKDHED